MMEFVCQLIYAAVFVNWFETTQYYSVGENGLNASVLLI
jgi:hypothetical protein